MSPETEKLLADFRRHLYGASRPDIQQFADPRHHEAIPVLINWLQDYSSTGAVDKDYQDIPFAELAADALRVVGEPAIPYLLAHLEANLQTPNWYLISVLQAANHLPDMMLFINYYRNFLMSNPYLAAEVRKLIEKHAPNTVLITPKLVSELTEKVYGTRNFVAPEILHQFVSNGDVSLTVPTLLDHLRIRSKEPDIREYHQRTINKNYNWSIVQIIRQIGTPLQVAHAALIIWRDIAINAAYILTCLVLLALPFVLIAIVWVVFGWIWGLVSIAVPFVGLAVLYIREKRKNRNRFAPRKPRK